MIKIGDGWFEETEIVAVRPQASGTGVRITIRDCGDICSTATMEEAEAALREAGIIPEEDEPFAPLLPEGARAELANLYEAGYEWVARDRDGRCYAFYEKPVKRGAYWEIEDGATAAASIRTGEVACLDWEDREPTFIPALLGL